MMKKEYMGDNMSEEELLCDKLAKARGDLYEYEYMFYSGMINLPLYVVDEMVKEIIKLRKEVKGDAK